MPVPAVQSRINNGELQRKQFAPVVRNLQEPMYGRVSQDLLRKFKDRPAHELERQFAVEEKLNLY